ncbi:hypothetical protein ACA910_005769 [Epithemia clementina (nom. ined.)]
MFSHRIHSIADGFHDSTDANMLYSPNVSKVEWVTPWSLDNPRRDVARPCWILKPWNDYENAELVLSQPSSSFFVMVIAIACFYYAVIYYKLWRNTSGTPGSQYRTLEFSRLFWSLALLCWGIGTFLAGLSYEALEWNLKCAFLQNNNDLCVRYSWLEVVYVMFQVAACDLSLLASAFCSDYLSVHTFWRIFWLGVFNYLIYSVLVASGALLGIHEFLSFQLCVAFCALSMIVGIYVNLWLPLTSEKKLTIENQKMLQSWGIMVLSGVVYQVYYSSGIEKNIWLNYGYWITANDFLHIILTVWAISMGLQVNYVTDSAELRQQLAFVLGGNPIPLQSSEKKNGKMQ